jgi:hypothetical protein
MQHGLIGPSTRQRKLWSRLDDAHIDREVTVVDRIMNARNKHAVAYRAQPDAKCAVPTTATAVLSVIKRV